MNNAILAYRQWYDPRTLHSIPDMIFFALTPTGRSDTCVGPFFRGWLLVVSEELKLGQCVFAKFLLARSSMLTRLGSALTEL